VIHTAATHPQWVWPRSTSVLL